MSLQVLSTQIPSAPTNNTVEQFANDLLPEHVDGIFLSGWERPKVAAATAFVGALLFVVTFMTPTLGGASARSFSRELDFDSFDNDRREKLSGLSSVDDLLVLRSEVLRTREG